MGSWCPWVRPPHPALPCLQPVAPSGCAGSLSASPPSLPPSRPRVSHSADPPPAALSFWATHMVPLRLLESGGETGRPAESKGRFPVPLGGAGRGPGPTRTLRWLVGLCPVLGAGWLRSCHSSEGQVCDRTGRPVLAACVPRLLVCAWFFLRCCWALWGIFEAPVAHTCLDLTPLSSTDWPLSEVLPSCPGKTAD